VNHIMISQHYIRHIIREHEIMVDITPERMISLVGCIWYHIICGYDIVYDVILWCCDMGSNSPWSFLAQSSWQHWHVPGCETVGQTLEIHVVDAFWDRFQDGSQDCNVSIVL
jgi:hypothetical protein